MALKVGFPIQMLHTNDLGPRQFPILKHLWPCGSADTALCTQTRNKRILGNSPAAKVFLCNFHKQLAQTSEATVLRAPTSCSCTSCSSATADLCDPSAAAFPIQIFIRLERGIQFLARICSSAPAKMQRVRYVAAACYLNCANLPPAARSTGLRRPRVVVPSGFLLSNSHWNKIRLF